MNKFDQLYYINLEYRKDMYDSINNVIDNLQFDKSKVTRINAIQKDNGAYGCALSHIQALENAKKNGYNKILIFEDDFVPYDYNDLNNKLTKFLNEVQDWDLVQLSSSSTNDIKYVGVDNVYKVLDSQGANAYGVSINFIDKLLKVFYESSNELSKEETYKEPCPYCIDVNWKKLQKDSNWYIFNPILGQENAKFSDVQKRFLEHFKKKLIKTYKDLKKYKFKNDGQIPKIVFRTSKFKLENLPENVKKVYEDDVFKNQEYSFFYFDDEDCQQSIIDSNDDRLINAYNTLIPTAFKADLWRYYMLNKYGGVYIDSSHIANIPYNEIIKSEKEIFVKDKLDEYGLNNSFIVCCKNNKVLKKAIESCIYNIENKRYDIKFLEITGPQLFQNAYREIYNIDPNIQYIEMGMPSIKHRLIDHDYSRVDTILGIMNENNQEVIKYRAIENHYSRLYNNNFDIIHYSNLYRNKLVYADEKINSIKKLYRDLLNREADIEGLINYYKCCSLENIELSIKESDEYHKLMIKTYKDLKEYKFENDGQIPKIVFRTGRYNIDELPKEIVLLYGKEMENNPNYTLFYFDDKDCEEFIILEYGIIMFDYYNQLIPTAFRADFWRYLILYKYGGIYIDFTMHALVSFDEIIKDYKEVYVRDTCDFCGIYNAFIAVKSNAELIGKAIEKVKENIRKKNKGCSALDVTGPTMLGRIFKHTLNLNFFDWIPIGNLAYNIYIYSNPKNEYILDGDKYIIKNRIDNHYELVYNEKKHQLLIDENNQIRPSNHYSRLWSDNKIFKT